MKTCILTITAALILFLLGSQMAIAQWAAQYGDISQGIFGPRVIGRPIISGNQTVSIFGPRSVGVPVTGPSNYFSTNAQITPNGFLVNNNQYYGYQVTTPFSAFSRRPLGIFRLQSTTQRSIPHLFLKRI